MNIVTFFGFLAPLLAFAMKGLYFLVKNYGVTIIVFTFLIRVVSFPLTLMQQKSTARNAAFQPMMDEIRKKYAKNQAKMNEEMAKFQQENGMKMMAGCLPSVISMLVIFSMLAVVQSPVKYMLDVPQSEIDAGIKVVQAYYNNEEDKKINANTQESILIGEINKHPQRFEGKMDKQWVEAIQNFNFNFLGMNLSVIPSTSSWLTLLLPVLSIITSIAMQVVMQLTSGQKQSTTMMISMMLLSVIMFGAYSFTAPVGFSLYYTISNVAHIVQQFIVKKIHNPEVEKQKVLAELEERKKKEREEKKQKKQVVVEEKGEKVVKDLKAVEIDRLRLEMARKLDDEKYGEEKKQEKERKQQQQSQAQAPFEEESAAEQQAEN